MGSNVEDILRATIDGTEYTEPPKSRVESLLVELKETIEEGGGGDSKPAAIQLKTKAAEVFDGFAINIPANEDAGMLVAYIPTDISKLKGYSFHGISILDDIPELDPGEDPIRPNIYAVVTQACYDPFEEQVRAWMYKVGKTDWALQKKDVNVSILFVKDSE